MSRSSLWLLPRTAGARPARRTRGAALPPPPTPPPPPPASATVGAPLLVQVGDTSSVVQVGDTSSALVATESAATAPAGATVTDVAYAKKRKKTTRKPAAAKAKTPENSSQIPAVEAS